MMNNKLPDSSLIIPTRNRRMMLRDTIASVLNGTSWPTEIVVVDQSNEPDDEIARMKHSSCEIRYHPTKTTGLSCARNIAIPLIHHDVVAVLDDDMFVAPDWYDNLITALVSHGEQTIVTGRIMPYAEGPDGFAPSTNTSTTPNAYTGRIALDPLAAGHMAMYRSVFKRVGPFDERLGAGTRFPAAEDNDFGFRAFNAGYTIRYVPEAVSYHRAWRRNREYWSLRWAYGRGQGAFYAKYFSLSDPFLLHRMSGELLRRVARVPERLFTKPAWAASDLVYTCAMLSGAGEWLFRYSRK